MDLKQSTIDGSNRPMTDDKLNTSFSVIIIMAKLANPFQLTRLIKLHCLTNTIDLTLKMTFAQVVKTSVTNNSSFQNYPHPDDHTIQTTDTPGFKPFTIVTNIFTFPAFCCIQRFSNCFLPKTKLNQIVKQGIQSSKNKTLYWDYFHQCANFHATALDKEFWSSYKTLDSTDEMKQWWIFFGVSTISLNFEFSQNPMEHYFMGYFMQPCLSLRKY